MLFPPIKLNNQYSLIGCKSGVSYTFDHAFNLSTTNFYLLTMGLTGKNFTRVLFATIMLMLLTSPCDAKSRHRRYKKHSKYFNGSRYKGLLPSFPASFIDGLPKGVGNVQFCLPQKNSLTKHKEMGDVHLEDIHSPNKINFNSFIPNT